MFSVILTIACSSADDGRKSNDGTKVSTQLDDELEAYWRKLYPLWPLPQQPGGKQVKRLSNAGLLLWRVRQVHDLWLLGQRVRQRSHAVLPLARSKCTNMVSG